jgi:hypothetical protein
VFVLLAQFCPAVLEHANTVFLFAVHDDDNDNDDHDDDHGGCDLLRVTDMVPIIVTTTTTTTTKILNAALVVSRLGGYMEVLPLPSDLWYGGILPSTRHNSRNNNNNNNNNNKHVTLMDSSPIYVAIDDNCCTTVPSIWNKPIHDDAVMTILASSCVNFLLATRVLRGVRHFQPTSKSHDR